MKNNQETLLLLIKQAMLAEHVHSVTWPLKIDEDLLSEAIDDATRLGAIQKIKDRLLIERKSVKPENLIQELAALTWSHNFLEHVAKAMATKIGRDRESALKLIDRELVYENTKSSNRQAGASKTNERRETDLKKVAKEKWQEHRESGKLCGATTLIKLLAGEPGIDDLSEDTAKGWTKQWNKEFKKG
ncbi:MAG: hypothetical protein NBV55_01315 [Polynucleobacter sp.]|nr:hypothetical protein [Polynucleobacter sp.]